MNNDSKQYRYRLQKSSTGHPKLYCPACGQKTLVPYIDVETGNIVHETCGRCDREVNCQYHLPPHEFFAQNGGGPKKQYFFPKKEFSQSADSNRFSCIHNDYLKKSMDDLARNSLLIYLREKYGFWPLVNSIHQYRLGTSHYWPFSTIFWQIDLQGNIRTGKIMQYDHHTGHRVKNPNAKVMWAHKLVADDNFQLRQCLFGEHLLSDTEKPVAIVESEKTAVIASMFFPDAIFVATGGISNLRREVCKVLKNRTVILFPDLGAEEIWREYASRIPELATARFSTWLQNHSTDEQKHLGLDLGDYLDSFNAVKTLRLEDFLE